MLTQIARVRAPMQRARLKVAMQVFIDDSASLNNQGYVCLAALIANDESWLRLHDGWAALLVKHEIPFLHTSDFLSASSQYEAFHTREYSERIDIVGGFADLIREHIPFVRLIAVDRPAYRAFTTDWKKKVNAQTLCFYRTFGHVWDRLEAQGHNEAVGFVVDDAGGQSQMFLAMWQKLKKKYDFARHYLGWISFGDDQFIGALQAADLVAASFVMEHARGESAWAPDSPLRRFSLASDPGKCHFQSEIWATADFENNRKLIKAAADYA